MQQGVFAQAVQRPRPRTREEEDLEVCPMNESVDESHPAYAKFLECFIAGASLQDIYTESESGFGIRRRGDLTDPEKLRRLRAGCRVQFDRIFGHMRNLVDPIDGLLGLKDKEVLDFGSGTGALAVAVALKGARVTATDPTPVSLAACNWRGRYFGLDKDRLATVAVGPAPGLPFPAGAFDMVTCNSVFEFIPARRDEHIWELARVLRPGGHLVLSTENGLFPVDRYTGAWFTLLRRAEMRRRNLPYGLTYFELRRWLDGTGRKVHDLSKANAFNSIDHFVARRRAARKSAVAGLAHLGNAALKSACRTLGVPSQILLPYGTFVFELQ
jgi:SAM-dependent methyltransferase